MIENSLIAPDQSGGAQIQPEPPAADLTPFEKIASGNPGAAFVSLETPSPAAKILADNLPALGQLGLQLYRSKTAAIIFNPKVVSPEQIKQADPQTLTPLDSLLSGQGSTQPPAPATPETAPSAPAPGVLSPVANPDSRIKGLLQPESPSSRPLPGQGKVLNDLIRRAT